ncbi:MAG: rod shape-determining protein RodA [Tissierellales bacterium]|nr:rod shape-determining protein RodA [Tissierellales bacterium]MBN2828150.1 rod shape-determining protein RodA [Tissierellales bacterium]
MTKINKKFWKRFDFLLVITVIILSIYGLVIIQSATASMSEGSARYVNRQLISFIMGFVVMLVLIFIDYEIYSKLYIPIYVLCNLLLIAVLIFGFGEEQWGARSWLSIGGLAFQPSEVVKFGLIISLAKYIDVNKETINHPLTLLKILIFVGIPIFLILLQPDFGTAMVFVFFILVMLFIGGLNIRYFVFFIILGLIMIPILGATLDAYQIDRIKVFLDPELDPQGAGYQVLQSKLAIGSGLIYGRGLFQGVQNQYGFLPAKQTDFIFAVIGEELGLLGGMLLILLYSFLIYRLIRIAKYAHDMFGSLIVIGITSMMFFHIFENIGMTIGLTPVTGIPLPFISYGGTFMLINMISVGLALSVAVKREGLEF